MVKKKETKEEKEEKSTKTAKSTNFSKATVANLPSRATELAPVKYLPEITEVVKVDSKMFDYAEELLLGVDIIKRELSAGLVMVGVSELRTRQLSVLMGLKDTLLGRLYDPKTINTLTVPGMLEVLAVVNTMEKDNIAFLGDKLSKLDWEKLQVCLKQVEETAGRVIEGEHESVETKAANTEKSSKENVASIVKFIHTIPTMPNPDDAESK